MVVIAQLVRASVCGTEGRGFEPHSPPERSAFAGLFSYTDMGSDPHCRSAALREAVNRAAGRRSPALWVLLWQVLLDAFVSENLEFKSKRKTCGIPEGEIFVGADAHEGKVVGAYLVIE